MDERTLRVLEYPKLAELLADCAACSVGKERARKLEPLTDAPVIRERLRETTEARRVIEAQGAMPFGGLSDISELLRPAAAGAALAGTELLRVGDVLRCARRMREYFADLRDEAPRLCALAGTLSDQRELEERIEATLDPEGEVVDDASEALVRLRRRAQTLHARLQERLNNVLAKLATGNLLQDRLVTVRSGRYCLPIRAEFQRSFKGIVHDQSDSGATVFMEPAEIVDDGNDLRQTELSIEQEVLRILRELSGLVGEQAEVIREDLATLGELDYISARAHLSRQMEATEPELGERGYVSLMDARHPLIPRDEVVPIDFHIGRGFTTLLITGPNTGGKTVTLKTVGLLNLMAQSGLHIPASAGSTVPVFDQIFADIGDEQSIEQSLSTFSSHMSQIIAILVQLRENALVLLDEIGAGTDPAEGSALARAILSELHQRGARTVATTHYNDLKTFAYSAEGMENACVEFDPETLQPTFRLLIGMPGSSNAFEIARRLGLPEAVIRRAQELVGESHLSVEEAIRRMEASQRDLERERGALQRQQEEIERLREQYWDDLSDLRSQRQEALEGGFDEALEVIRSAEREAARIIADLQRQTRQSKVTEQRRQEIAQLRERIKAQEEQSKRRTQRRRKSAADDREVPTAVQPGDRVYVRSLQREGTVVEAVDEKLIIVQVGRMRVECARADLRLPPEPERSELPGSVVKIQTEKQFTVPRELHLLGLTVDEAIPRVEKYLDDALLAGMSPLRIVHGKGTGALRQGIHELLRSHPQVRSFHLATHNDGGEGVTIVEL